MMIRLSSRRILKLSIQPTLTEEQRKKLPTVPEKGDFNIQEVLQSEFFFA